MVNLVTTCTMTIRYQTARFLVGTIGGTRCLKLAATLPGLMLSMLGGEQGEGGDGGRGEGGEGVGGQANFLYLSTVDCL